MSLGRQEFLDLKLAEYQRNKLKASTWACSGIARSLSLLEKDAVDVKTKDYDIIDECGVNLEGKDPREIFAYSPGNFAEGFKIGKEGPNGEFRYGLNDEESRLNINGGNDLDKNKIKVLLAEYRIAQPQEISSAITEWISAGGKPDTAKNEKFSVPEELQAVLESFYLNQGNPEELSRSRSKEVYNSIKDNITIYGDSRLNINTASAEVLRIFVLAFAEIAGQRYNNAQKYSQAGSSLSEKLLILRQSRPLKAEGDIVLENLTGEEERNIFSDIKPYLKVKSEVFLIPVVGNYRGVRHYISAVYNRKEKRTVYWHEG